MSDAKQSPLMPPGWFYSRDGERKGPFTPEQIGALLSAGVLDAHSRMWSEDLGDWTPLSRTALRPLIGEAPIEPPAVETVVRAAPARGPIPARPGEERATALPAKTYRRYDNRGLGKVVQWSIWFNMILLILECGALLKSGQRGDSRRLMAALETEEMLALTGLPLLIASVLFLTWCYRVTANAWQIAGPQSVTPAGAVYWYFVPIFCFWQPHQAMANVHRVFAEKQTGTVPMWWGLWWASFALGIAVGFVHPDGAAGTEDVGSYLIWFLIISAANALWLGAGAEMVKEIRTDETLKMAAA